MRGEDKTSVTSPAFAEQWGVRQLIDRRPLKLLNILIMVYRQVEA